MAVQKRKYSSTDRKVTDRKVTAVPSRSPEQWPFTRKNYILGAVALVTMTIGYVLLGQGDITAAPILLVLAYVVLVPWAILAREKKPAVEVPANNEPTAP